jgi:hypothetical protein
MKQAMQAIQRLNTFGRLRIPVQQRLKINPGQFRRQMRKADEAAEHAVTIKAIGEIGMSRPSNDVALIPVGARIRIQQRPQPLKIEPGVGDRAASPKNCQNSA